MLNSEFVIVNVNFVALDIDFECYFSKTMTLKENLEVFFELIEPNITQFYSIDKIYVADNDNDFIDKSALIKELKIKDGNLLKIY